MVVQVHVPVQLYSTLYKHAITFNKAGATPCLQRSGAKGRLLSSQVGIAHGGQGVYWELYVCACVFNISKDSLQNNNKPKRL